MSVIIILILFSVLVAGGFLFAFIWAVRSGQYDDTESPAVRMLFEDKKKHKQKENILNKRRLLNEDEKKIEGDESETAK